MINILSVPSNRNNMNSKIPITKVQYFIPNYINDNQTNHTNRLKSILYNMQNKYSLILQPICKEI